MQRVAEEEATAAVALIRYAGWTADRVAAELVAKSRSMVNAESFKSEEPQLSMTREHVVRFQKE